MASDEDEDDYLSMTFDNTASNKVKETSIQRTARLKKEAAERGRVPSKAQRAQAAEEAREKALAAELDSSNKGAKMMAKMGFKGGALGKTENARTRPIEIQMKDDRTGIGMENEKKRKIREAAEAMNANEKRVKLTEEEYRERARLEREEKRQEGQMWSAMRTLEGFEDEGAAGEGPPDGEDGKADQSAKKTKAVPLRSINLLWRPLVRQRLERDRERRMRNDLAQSLSRRNDYNDESGDEDDKLVFGTEVEEDLEEEDEELDEFQALPTGERLDKILAYLREKYHYCFWCKFRYTDEEMDGCPGLTEDEHG